MSKQMKAKKTAAVVLGAILIPPAKMPTDALGNVVQMTFGELQGKLPDLRYEGSKKDGVPNGSGVITHPLGLVWSGEFCDGTLPRGVLTFGARRYEGEFLNLWPHGTGQMGDGGVHICTGRFSYGDVVEGRHDGSGGMVYEGSLKDGTPHGNGKLTVTGDDGIVWEGFFENGQLKRGKLTMPDGSFDEGVFLHLNLHGKGRRVHPDGSECSGDFKHGDLHGFGTYLDPASDSIIEGEWRDGECVDGKRILGNLEYEGRMADGVPQGIGILRVDDIQLEGTFDRDVICGECSLIHASDAEAVMTVRKSGEANLRSLCFCGHELTPSPGRDGHATIRFPGARLYEGGVLHGRAHGAGELTIPDVGTCNGTFSGGLLEGMATIKFASGTILNGTFRNGLANGVGNYKGAGGAVYIGNFKDGLPCGLGALFVPRSDSYTFTPVDAGQSLSSAEFDQTELHSFHESLAGFRVEFPGRMLIEAIPVKGKGLFIDTVTSGPLPPGGEPFSVVLIPERNLSAKPDEAKAA